MATTELPVVDAPEIAEPPRLDAPDRRWWGDGLGPLLAGGLALMAARPLSDNSFLTHLATGRLMLDGGLPATNPFLYSSSDFPVPSWWWSWILGVVDAIAGGAGIRLLTVAIAAALGLAIVRLTRPASTALAVVLPVACAFMTLLPFLNARPHLPGFLLLAAMLLVVKERRSPWWLLPVFLFWVNVHGSWFYGVVVLGLVLVVDAVDERRVERRDVGYVLAAVAGVVVGGGFYPDRFGLVALPFEQLGDDTSRRALEYYKEWAPAGWGHPLTWLLLAMGIVGVVGAVRSRRWATALGCVAMVALGMSAGRLLPLAAITLVPWATAGLAGFGTIALPRGRTAAWLTGVGALFLGVAVVWSVSTPAYDLGRYPVAAVDWLDARDLAGAPNRVLTRDFAGNYIDWRLGERASTFVDDRAPADTILEYVKLYEMSDDWRDGLRVADPDVVVWPTDGELSERLAEDPGWYDAGDFDDFTVFCRSSIADRCR